MGGITGTIRFEDDSDEVRMLPFGQWFLKMVAREADGEGWDFKQEGPHLYVWSTSEVTAGKNRQHFLDKEHLHLIDNGTDVDISTKHPQALNVNRDGTYDKPTVKDKEPQHLTGTKALNRGESPPITICTRNATPAGVVDWQKTVITTLRRSAFDWLKAEADDEQMRQFNT